jgi:hypothetical protein
MDNKVHLLLRILEANIDNQIDGKYYTSISTYDIRYFMIKEGFKTIKKTDIFELLKLLEKFSIIRCQYLSMLETGDEKYEIIRTPDNETINWPKKSRLIWFNNNAFYKLDGQILDLTSKEERNKLITKWVNYHRKKRYRIKPNMLLNEFVEVPVQLIKDKNLENDAFRYFCALLYVSKYGNKKGRNEVAESIGIDNREGIRLLEELGKNGCLTIEAYFKE